jgi:NTE family protein
VEIAFNAAFLREASILVEWQAAARQSRWLRGPLERRLAALRLHVIDADDALAGLPGRTRMVAHLPFLERLRDLGRERLQQWWAEGGRREGNAHTAWFGTSSAGGSSPPAA